MTRPPWTASARPMTTSTTRPRSPSSFADQIACADMIVVNKSDLLGEAGRRGPRDPPRRRRPPRRPRSCAPPWAPCRSRCCWARTSPPKATSRPATRSTTTIITTTMTDDHHDDDDDHHHDQRPRPRRLRKLRRGSARKSPIPGPSPRPWPKVIRAHDILRLKGFRRRHGQAHAPRDPGRRPPRRYLISTAPPPAPRPPLTRPSSSARRPRPPAAISAAPLLGHDHRRPRPTRANPASAAVLEATTP